MKYVTNDKFKYIVISNDNNEIVSRLFFVPSYLIWEFPSRMDNKFLLKREDSEVFYQNIKWLMKQKYMFPHEYSSKTNDKLIWLSEHCYDLDDEFEVKKTPRLIIEKDNNNRFEISYSIPFLEKNNIYNNGALIYFAPACNGYYVKNINTKTTLQDDMINVLNNTVESKKLKLKRRK